MVYLYNFLKEEFKKRYVLLLFKSLDTFGDVFVIGINIQLLFGNFRVGLEIKFCLLRSQMSQSFGEIILSVIECNNYVLMGRVFEVFFIVDLIVINFLIYFNYKNGVGEVI